MDLRYQGFIKAYENVFDHNGSVRICGRNACKTLIEEAHKIDSRIIFGNQETGFMNILEIQKLYKRLSEQECEHNGVQGEMVSS